MTQKLLTPPPVLAALQPKQKYNKPSFEVIDIIIESPLLSGSSTPTSKKSPINPLTPGTDW